MGCGPAQSPPRCTKCNSPPINGQCTNFILFDVALQLPVPIKGLTGRGQLCRVSTDLGECPGESGMVWELKKSGNVVGGRGKIACTVRLSNIDRC